MNFGLKKLWSLAAAVALVGGLCAPAMAQTDVATITEARAQAAGTLVRITGEVIVVSRTNGLVSSSSMNYGMVVQDASGSLGQTGIVVYDPDKPTDGNPQFLTRDYDEGDVLTNLVGTITVYNSILELEPEGSQPTLVRTGDTLPAPYEITSATTSAEAELLESTLVKISAADIAETGNWTSKTNYTLTAPSGVPVAQIRVEGWSRLVIEDDLATAKTVAIPLSVFDISGVLTQYSSTYQIQPRFEADVVATALPDDPDVEVAGAFYVGGNKVGSTTTAALPVGTRVDTTQALTISNTTQIINNPNSAFALTTNLGSGLTVPANGGSVDLNISFTPTHTGLSTATLQLVSNDVSQPTTEILLSGMSMETSSVGFVYFSEYVEGSSNNKAIEIFNGNTTPLDLTTISLELYANGSINRTSQITFDSGSIAPNDVFVIVNTSAGDTLKALADLLTGSVVTFNGDDVVLLKQNGVIIDSIGRLGEDPGTEWVSGGVSTLNMTLLRNSFVSDPNPFDAFYPSVQWTAKDIDDFSNLGTHTPGVNSVKEWSVFE